MNPACGKCRELENCGVRFTQGGRSCSRTFGVRRIGFERVASSDWQLVWAVAPRFPVVLTATGDGNSWPRASRRTRSRSSTRPTRTIPKYALAFFHRAEAKQRLGQMRAAIDDYTKALRLDKEISGMDDVHQSDAVPFGAERVRAYFNRATLLNQVGEARDAVEGFTDALHLDPAYADAYCGRGAAYLASGFPEQAIVDLDAAIRLVPNSCEALCLRARAKLAAGKDRQAIEDARSAIHLDANCGDAFLTLGSALLASSDQEPDVAVKHLREAFRLYKALAPPFSPGLAQAYFDLGINLDKAGQGMEAEKAFDEAKRLDEKYAGLYQEHKTKTAVAVTLTARRRRP